MLIGGIVVSRLISESALKKLSFHEKVEVIDGLAPARKFGLLVFLAAVIATYQNPPLLISVTGLYIVSLYAYTFTKLSRLDLPKPYVKAVAAGALVSFLTFVAFIYLSCIQSGMA